MWTAYGHCCHLRSLDPMARVCPDCGHLLLRCRSSHECQQLLEPGNACPLHLAPQLHLEKGAVLKPRVGDRITLPLVFANGSKFGAGLRVRQVLQIEPGREPQELAPYWDRVAPGEERPLSVDTAEMATGGSSRVALVFVVTARLGELEEDFAFAAEILLKVRRRGDKQVSQHIHVSGGQFEPGAAAVVQTGPSVHESFASETETGLLELRKALPMHRAEAFELRHGVRGYSASGVRVPRNVEVRCEGFPSSDGMPTGRPFLEKERLACGRNSRLRHDRNPHPNDVTLLAYDPRSGGLDRARSARISGVHLHLYLRNDRLVLCSRGANGTLVDGAPVERDEEIVLESGARVQPAPLQGGGNVEMLVSLSSRDGTANHLTLTRRVG